METVFAIMGSLLAALGVSMGAFGTHGLRRRALAQQAVTFETGVRYHLVHSLAILFTSQAVSLHPDSPWPVAAGLLFTAGIILFSGSLYMLVITSKRRLGAVTPVGGLAFLLGWLSLAITYIFPAA